MNEANIQKIKDRRNGSKTIKRIELKHAEIQEQTTNFNMFEQYSRAVESQLDNEAFNSASYYHNYRASRFRYGYIGRLI